jgi:hypothetical protein
MKSLARPQRGARQPFFGEISSRFEFSIKFEPTFLRNARICVLSPCDKRILAWYSIKSLDVVIKPSVQTVAKIAKALGVPMEDLVK